MREKSPSPRVRASILAPFPTHFRHQSKVKMATIVAQQLSAGCVGVSSPEYELTATLPRRVNADGARAKFSAKRSELRVILPISSS